MGTLGTPLHNVTQHKDPRGILATEIILNKNCQNEIFQLFFYLSSHSHILICEHWALQYIDQCSKLLHVTLPLTISMRTILFNISQD